VIRSKSDDGLIVWLNGQEVYRSTTVAAGEIPYTYSSTTVQSASEPPAFITQTILRRPQCWRLAPTCWRCAA